VIDSPFIAYVNQSAGLTAADCARIIAAIEAQDREDFAPAWGCAPCPPKLFDRIEDVPAGAALILFVAKSDVDGAAGYHTEQDSGRVSGIVAVDSLLAAGWSKFDGAQSISACASHEHCEARKDPFVNVWVDMPDGGQDSFEMCDRVQGQSYRKLSASVSDFLLPHAFDGAPPAGAKFDFLGVLRGPFDVDTANGGYASRRTSSGKTFSVGEMPAARRHPIGRTARRMGS